MKYQRWDRAFHFAPDPVKNVLDKMLDIMHLHDDRDMRWVVDYKVRDLKKGDFGCPLPEFHTDCVANPWHESKPETHLVFSTHVGTKFIETPIPVRPEDDHFNKVMADKWDWCLRYRQVRPNTITKYGRFNMHAGPLILKDCRRVLIRLSQTEVI